jgi:hypothetical protein
MQLDFFDIPSPCIGICQSDNKGYCLGCFRTREERQKWINLTVDEKQKVIKRCRQRKRRKAAKSQPIIASQSQAKEEPVTAVQQPSLLDQMSENTLDKNTLSSDEFSDFDL